MFQISTFYEFKDMKPLGELSDLKVRLKGLMVDHSVNGTIIVAEEGFNASVSGKPTDIEEFVTKVSRLLSTEIRPKSSFHCESPFRRARVKVKSEIVTLRKHTDPRGAAGTHVQPGDWDELISRNDVTVLDTRNDYEYRNGTFKNAINPGTASFSELPDWIAGNLDPSVHKEIAIFCTGGIRCEKFAPYLLEKGFERVYQLSGGILRYLEDVRENSTQWDGECFVFDERVTVGVDLTKGAGVDHSAEAAAKRRITQGGNC